MGPTRVAHGVTVAAGTILRKDALQAGHLYTGQAVAGGAPRPYDPTRYGNIGRLVKNNLIFIGNLRALQAWYRDVRSRFMRSCPFREACRLGGVQVLEMAIKERIKRLDDLAQRLERDAADDERGATPRAFVDAWPDRRQRLKRPPDPAIGATPRATFMSAWTALSAASHVAAMAALAPAAKAAATAWLQEIVDDTWEGME